MPTHEKFETNTAQWMILNYRSDLPFHKMTVVPSFGLLRPTTATCASIFPPWCGECKINEVLWSMCEGRNIQLTTSTVSAEAARVRKREMRCISPVGVSSFTHRL